MAGEQIDPDYVDATISAESSGNPNATSYDKYGKPIARGLMQLTDTTGQSGFKKLQASGDISADAEYTPYDPEQNRIVGTDYLSAQETAFKDKRLASASYNYGPTAVKHLQEQYGDSYEDIAAHLPVETQKYVARVAKTYNKLKDAKADEESDPSTFGNREDGTPKGSGFLGVLRRPGGGVSTELSVGVEIDGKETEIPTLVPGLSKSEINTLLTNDKGIDGVPQSIIDKATEHAKQRIAAGKSPFASNDESPVAAKRSPQDQPEPDKNAELLSTIKRSPPNAQGFAKSALVATEDSDFATLPVQSQADLLTQIYGARNWGKDGYNTYKDTMTKIWNTADPEDLPDINHDIGSPPVVLPGQNPADVLQKWKEASTQKLLQSGKSPAYYGDRLDEYFDNATKAETEAFGIRNESLGAELAYGTGNFVRAAAKGVISNVTNAAAYAVRIASTPENAFRTPPDQLDEQTKSSVEVAQERAAYIQKLPDILGNPSNAYKYATDKTGKLQLNPDGTPRLKAQEAASITADGVGEAIGQIGGLLAGGWALKAFGAPSAAISTVIGGTNALNLANSSYQTVYNDTNGDSRKALTASLMAAPIGFVGELGQLKVISKEISPVIQTMTAADKALYVAKSLTKSAAIGAGTGAAMDVAQQGVETLQSGKPYNLQRTEAAALTTGAAGALVGSIHDYVAGSVSGYAQGKMRATGDKALVDFRNSTDTTRVIQVPAVSKDILDTFGMDVTSNNNGTVTVTKRGAIVPEDAPIGELVSALSQTYSSNDIKELGAKQSALSAKQNRTPEEDSLLTDYNKVLQKVTEPEYQNGVKALERAIEDHPDKPSLLVDRDPQTNLWKHAETGEEALALKDLLIKKEPEYTKDLSDISTLKVLDEDAVKNRVTTQEPIDPKATEEHINVSNKLDKVNNEIRDLQNERDSLQETGGGDEDPNAERRAELKDQITQKTIEKRNLQSDVVRTKGPRDTEQAALEAQKLTQKNAEKQKTADLKTIETLKKKGNVGLYNSKDHSITVTSHDTPEAKAETVAHELAHGVAKDLELSKEANNAIDSHIKDLEAAVPVSTVKEIAKKVFLPNALERATKNTPENAPANKLNGKSKNAIINRDEVIANQVGAVMLKRAGKDIGDFKILPEVEAALRKTKLPDVNEVVNPTSKDKVLNAPITPNVPTAPSKQVSKDFDFTTSFKSDLSTREQFEEAKDKYPGTSVKLRNGKKVKLISGEVEGGGAGEIVAYDSQGNRVGALGFSTAESEPGIRENPGVYVDENWRRQGLATEMYNLAKEKGALIPSIDQEGQVRTDEGQAFREAYDAKQSNIASAPPTDNTPRFDTGSGKFGETRFSKKVREVNPDVPPVNYEVQSKKLAEEAAQVHIKEHGLDKTQSYLSSEDSWKMNPKDRSALVEGLYAQRKAEVNANPTPENQNQLSLARQLRSKAGTPYGQGLAFLKKFSSSDTFADLLGNINRAYIDAGMKPPDYTQAMIDELKGNFDRANKLPKDSRARETEVNNIFEKTLGFNKTNWGSFLAKYARTNLLSGLGTQLVVANSSFYMGPVLTALAHPFQGGGLIWRAMWNAKGLAASNARAVFAGEGGKALFNGIYDPSPVNMGEKPSVESGFAKLYSKFGDKFLNALAATHTYAKTLSAEGFLANRGYNELRAEYGNDPAKFSAEVSKLILNPKDIETAKAQAVREYQEAGIEAKPGTIGARAYEILRTQSNTPEELQTAEEYAKGVSHAGEMANVTHQMALEFFNARFFQNPFLRPVKFIVQPFGRAMLALSDYAIDYIPGNIAIDPALRRLGNALDTARGGTGDYYAPRSEALQTRLRNAQAVGAVMSATLLGLSRSGLFTITGDEEKSDLEGEGKAFAGGKATNRADFQEAKQKGVPAYSFVFPNGFAVDYKDLPGLNALAYGLFRVNKAIDSGESAATATAAFYKGAFSYALPFFGGGTLNSPMYTLGQAILHPEVDPKKAGDAVQESAERWAKFYQQSADTTEKFLVPFSSLLRDVQEVYDQPEESHQALLQRAFRNVPGVSTLVGSQNQVDRFGDPVQRTALEHTPGVGRIVGAVTPESGDVWDKLNAKGLVVKEMGNYINFHKADVGSADKFEQYQKTREERISSAYAKTLTPDEWNQFRAATGPYIKAVANSIADSNLSHDTAQETLTKRITAIEEQALKRYVATGHF